MNISLANLNMDIESERTRMEENEMVGVEDLQDDIAGSIMKIRIKYMEILFSHSEYMNRGMNGRLWMI